MMKVCKQCGEKKDITEFNRKSSNKSGVRAICKTCSRTYDKEYSRQNPLKQNLKSARYRATKSNQTPHLTKRDKARIQLMLNWQKQLPGTWHMDHIIPLSKGGKHHPDNLHLIPASQNLTKMNKHPKRFYGRHFDFITGKPIN